MIRKYVFMTLLPTFLVISGCKSRQVEMIHEREESRQRLDSVSLRVERVTRPVVIPEETVRMRILPDSLSGLPPGAGFRKQEGRVTATLTNLGKEGYEITANCDSLIILVSDLRTEIFHLTKDQTDLKEQLDIREKQIVREPDGFQWFQIWLGRILSASLVLYILLRRFLLKIPS